MVQTLSVTMDIVGCGYVLTYISPWLRYCCSILLSSLLLLVIWAVHSDGVDRVGSCASLSLPMLNHSLGCFTAVGPGCCGGKVREWWLQ